MTAEGTNDVSPNEAIRLKALETLELLRTTGAISNYSTAWLSTKPIEIMTNDHKFVRMTAIELIDLPNRGFRVWRRATNDGRS